MGAIAEIFREFTPEYLRRFGDTMPPEHRKVIDAILLCRTEENGSVVYRCEECGLNHILNRSCGNRHCPQCQHHKTTQWLERQMERMLPGHHFMMTFTVPEELRDFIRSNIAISLCARRSRCRIKCLGCSWRSGPPTVKSAFMARNTLASSWKELKMSLLPS